MALTNELQQILIRLQIGGAEKGQEQGLLRSQEGGEEATRGGAEVSERRREVEVAAGGVRLLDGAFVESAVGWSAVTLDSLYRIALMGITTLQNRRSNWVYVLGRFLHKKRDKRKSVMTNAALRIDLYLTNDTTPLAYAEVSTAKELLVMRRRSVRGRNRRV